MNNKSNINSLAKKIEETDGTTEQLMFVLHKEFKPIVGQNAIDNACEANIHPCYRLMENKCRQEEGKEGMYSEEED